MSQVSIFDANHQPLTTSQIGNSYYFTARRLDSETGLYYYRARWYDPELGRFLTTDPIEYEAGVNLYTYVNNNPLNFTDPSGLISYIRDACGHIIGIYTGEDISGGPEEEKKLQQQVEADEEKKVEPGKDEPGAPEGESWQKKAREWARRTFEGSRVGAGLGAKIKVKAGLLGELEIAAEGIEGIEVTREGLGEFIESSVGVEGRFGPFKGKLKYESGEPDVSLGVNELTIHDMTEVSVGGTVPFSPSGAAVSGELHIHLDEIIRW